MNEREQLFVAQAFYNAIAEQVSTKDPNNLRGRVSEEYKHLYEETGAKSFDAKLNNEKVGTFSLTVSKPTDSRTEQVVEIDDENKIFRWDGYAYMARHFAGDHILEAVRHYFNATGELPPGCSLVEVNYPGSPGGEVTKTTLKVDTQKVAEVIKGNLPEVAMALLEGGSDD